MTQGLGELLRRGADAVSVPPVDVGGLVAEVGRRRRRRRVTIVAVGAVTVSAIVAASVLATVNTPRTRHPSPAHPVSPSTSATVDAQGARPLVYADGRTVHVGDKTIEADKPVAFIAPTDDGAVYEATLDGTLWFTDGSTTQVIGTSWFTAAPTARAGVVATGNSGSLVAWADQSHGMDKDPTELVVYDTSRREELDRIPVPEPGRHSVTYVGDDEVWYGADPGIDQRVYRFDVSSGKAARLNRSDLDAVLDTQPRVFTAMASDGRVVHGPPSFTEQAGRLVAGIHYSVAEPDAVPVTLADGSQLRLRLPAEYVAPWPADEAPTLAVSQWLDEGHIVLWADDGGGDLPAKTGDLLVCRLPNGVCQITVPQTSRSYVAPYLSW
jgi:hypothetical protein